MKLLLLIVTAALFTSPLPAAEKPNIIFILTDDLGYGDLGVLFQNEREADNQLLTPHLDQFANEGIQMRRHYCPAPVCAPSRASFLTGFHQGHAEIRNNQFDRALGDDYSIASVLQTAGYATGLIGKYGLQGDGENPEEWSAYPTKRGFDEFFGYVRHRDGHLHYPAHDWPIGNSDRHRAPVELWHDEEEISATLDLCYTADLFTAYAKKWITRQAREESAQPFFLFLAYDTPHAALQLPTTEYPSGGGLDGGVQWLGEDGKMINTAVGEIDSYVHPDHAAWSELEQRQAGPIRRIDDAIGDLKQLLQDLGIDDDTLVVFTSDNGPHEESYIDGAKYKANLFQGYGPFDGIKRDVYEGGIRVPTLVRWPAEIAAGRIDETPSQFHDWLNTFLDAAGVPPLAQSDGVSLLPLLTGEGEQKTPTTYVEYFNNQNTPHYEDFAPERRGKKRKEQQAVFLDGYKGLRTNIQSHDDAFEIYDLAADPDETTNLAGTSPKFESMQEKLKDRITQLRRPDLDSPRPYDEQPIAALDESTGRDGVLITFAGGEYPWVPAIESLDETSTIEQTEMVWTAPAPGVVEITGSIAVEETGDYTVSIQSPGSVLLHLHEALVIDGDSPQSESRHHTASAKLEKGIHPYRITYLTDGPGIDLKIDGPSKAVFQ